MYRVCPERQILPGPCPVGIGILGDKPGLRGPQRATSVDVLTYLFLYGLALFSGGGAGENRTHE